MKPRVLFVLPRTAVHLEWRRALRGVRAEWDLTFATSGLQALDLMALSPFDAVVTELRMSGMSGPALLKEVRQRSPKALRLILTRYADRELILQSTGIAHRLLAEPCEAAHLKAAMERTWAAAETLSSQRVRELVARLEHLPSVPHLYARLVELLQSELTTLEEVGGLIERDAGLTAGLLKLVNSTLFGLRRPVFSAADAVTYLGVQSVKYLVLSVQTFAQFETRDLAGLSLADIWKHSVQTADAARRLALTAGAAHGMADAAFVGGLLHDVGKLVLASDCRDAYQQACAWARTHQASLREGEVQLFGCDHAAVGGYLLGLWGLPEPVVEAVALHHEPDGSSGRSFGPLAAVHIANTLVQEASTPRIEGLATSPLALSYLARLGVADRLEAWRAEILELQQKPETDDSS